MLPLPSVFATNMPVVPVGTREASSNLKQVKPRPGKSGALVTPEKRSWVTKEF